MTVHKSLQCILRDIDKAVPITPQESYQITIRLWLPAAQLFSAQKCGDAPNTLQAGRSERSQTGDLLGFNTGPVDPKNPESVPVNLTYN